MGECWDVVIVGGGVMGSATAYFLAAEPGFAGRVLVLEADPSYEWCSSVRSNGAIRQQFSIAQNIEMCLFGARFFREAGTRLVVDGEAPDLGFREHGYLFLVAPERMDVLCRNHARQTALGAANVILDASALAERYPWLNTEGLGAGCLGTAMEGWIDPTSLLHAYRRKAISGGVTYRAGEVVALERCRDRVVSVTLADGARVACGAVVDAAGFHAARVAAMAGIPLPVEPRKRFVFVFECREDVPHVPHSFDPTGVYWRREGRGFITGVLPPESEDGPCWDYDIDHGLFESVIWPTLAHRVPAFEAIRQTTAWACHYDYNRLDENAILGPHPEVANLYFINGFSGHGIQQSPAAGRALSELIVDGAYRTLDLSIFGYERIGRAAPVWEKGVVGAF